MERATRPGGLPFRVHLMVWFGGFMASAVGLFAVVLLIPAGGTMHRALLTGGGALLLSCVVAVLLARGLARNFDRMLDQLVRGRDVTKAYADELERRVRTHEQMALDLQQSKRFSENIVAAVPSGLVVLRRLPTGLIAVSLNQSLCAMFGCAPADVIGRNLEGVLGMLGLSEADRLDLLRRDGILHEIREARPPGQGTLFVSLGLTRIETGGDVEMRLLVVENVTERVRAQNALRESGERLRQAEKLQAVGRLAGGIAHDFNNLLTVITGFSELALDELAADSPVRASVQEIRAAADRASALTRQLLAFGRKQILQPRVLDLGALVANMEKMLRRLIGEDIELGIEAPRGLWEVKADPNELEQMVLNLAANARDAMPTGGRITIGLANVELDASSRAIGADSRPGPHVMMAVSDTGTGMSQEALSHLFEPFYTTKRTGKGTGLGLSSVYGIVERSGGRIEVSSEIGQGTTFRVYLPREEQGAPAAKAAEAPRGDARGSESILLVEDDDAIRGMARSILQRRGYRVLDAADPRAALEAAARFPGAIDMLLTDVVMQHMNGRELAVQLAAGRPGTRLLFMSGYTDDATLRNGILEGMPFLQKPFTPAQLEAKVREVLDQVKDQGQGPGGASAAEMKTPARAAGVPPDGRTGHFSTV